MVGLVIVSHSRPLADALSNLVRQVASNEAPIAVAAGVGEQRQEFGTDAVEISEAIQSVYSPDGVCVLMDLGSAVLSAQLALDLLPPEQSEKVTFCAAPLVEGAIAAGVQIGLGSDLETVCREAKSALLPKSEQLGEAALPAAEPAAPVAISGAGLSTTLTLTNLHGLHARPAARFVQTAARFNADIQVTNLTKGKGPVSAKSLNALATLGAIEYHQVKISAAGPDAADALAALSALIEENFGEAPAAAATGAAAPPTPAAEAPTEDGASRAVPVSEGIAIGPFYRYRLPQPPIPQSPAEDPAIEWQKLQLAIATTQKVIQQRIRQLRGRIADADLAIFDAHLLILEDPDLLAKVRQRIEEQRQNAAQAWHEILSHAADEYRSLDDPYLQQRAMDVEDVYNQVLFALAGKPSGEPILLEEAVLLYAEDLTPSETSRLDMGHVLGMMTAGGGPTSHSAILARALGIPAVSGVSTLMERLEPGTLVAIDGFSGAVWVDPSAEVQAHLNSRREEWLAARQRLLQSSQEQARTSDGQRVEVFANIGNVMDAQAAIKNSAEGVGLLRTEFLFLTRETPPSEDEQMAALQQIGEAMCQRPITVRTLDVGGDKEVPYIQLPAEPNPFLGVRAIRLSLHNPDLFMPQLRAILRAAVDFPLRIMFPMIANVDEVRQARAWLQKAHDQLQEEKLPNAWPIETGIMIEIPSAALLSRVIAKEVDFFSIGTNDLTQYTLAAERGNPILSPLADALHPAVLRLIGEVVEAAHAEGKWVGVCGELAGDPLAVPVLIGLGVDELSLNPAGIPRVKAIVHHITTGSAQTLAQKILLAESAPAARSLARNFLSEVEV